MSANISSALAELEAMTNHSANRVGAKRRQIGEAMRKRRMQSGISLRAFAKQLGVAASHLSDMEQGKRTYLRKWVEKAEGIITLGTAAIAT